jgi:hypothetical protein
VGAELHQMDFLALEVVIKVCGQMGNKIDGHFPLETAWTKLQVVGRGAGQAFRKPMQSMTMLTAIFHFPKVVHVYRWRYHRLDHQGKQIVENSKSCSK